VYEKRLFTEEQAIEYIGLGRTKGRSWLREIGATKHFGRSVRYDRRIIDRALDIMPDEREAQGA
jgi:hypothetical protein